MQWVRINDGTYINASHISAVEYVKQAQTYKITLSNKTVIVADTFEPVTTYDIKDEREE